MEHTLLHRRLAADLSPEMLYALLRLRVEVFVVEQKCHHQELDGADLSPTTRHFWLAPDGEMQNVQATLRLLEPTDGRFWIGRVCTAPNARHCGGARRLMQAALAEVGRAPCGLNSQSHLVGLYAGFGFVPSGPEFLDHGIPHVPMRREVAA